jgi:hypothetical protein
MRRLKKTNPYTIQDVFKASKKTDAILRLRELPKDVVLFIDEYFNLTLVEI